MRNLFKEASEQFKARRKAIDDYHKQVAAEKKLEEKAQKAVEPQAKKAEKEAEKAEKATVVVLRRMWATS
ncbi:hypothetical protein K443DRAFT_13211 [Laccaria amethystina LaAM-08-1]|uniref:Uncharacterized protein n=1 Tax=Laccaria amethystina LaAM-08-1 TaxID=1095629 RepID=A0A0C9WPP2_9AGAR|nr:hypothetical protein K443DRAFT_13211 [Laccaria amethystina LaAM-08-1]